MKVVENCWGQSLPQKDSFREPYSIFPSVDTSHIGMRINSTTKGPHLMFSLAIDEDSNCGMIQIRPFQ